MPRRPRAALGLLAAVLTMSPPAQADYSVDEQETLTVSADLRIRAEHDWAAVGADGGKLSNRTRLRLRARLGLAYQAADWLSLAARLRTGSHDSQQSPHITFKDFDDNPTGDHDVMFDRYFLALANDAATIWVGRNDFPFWSQNEMLWDADATLTGVSAGYQLTPGASLRGGWFKLPDGGIDLNGELAAGQAVLQHRPLANLNLTLAAGVYAIRGDDAITRLRNGNGSRDYTIWSVSVRTESDLKGRPLAVGLDAIHNAQSYQADDPDGFTAANRDRVNGFVFVASYGQAKECLEWQLAYSYAYLETLAVNASYAQDDWVRWGSATQVNGTDLKGHELKGLLGLGHGLDVVARWYWVEAIASGAEGKRLRLDLNWRL